MTTLRVRLKKTIDDSYPVRIEDRLLQKLPSFLKKGAWGEKYAIIADRNLGNLGAQLLASLKKNGVEAHLFIFPPGDAHKTIETCTKLMAQMLNKKVSRKDAIVAFGGGVTGDISGFIAAIYMRGIPYIHIPTSVVAMVDSSMGGKTGVNLAAGKNLIGRMHQPKAVYIDPTLLNGLPQDDYLSGMGEVVKYAAILSPRLFKLLEKNRKGVLERSPEILNTLIIQSCQMKAKIVERDEEEKDYRRILNYGHTIGHALEKLSNYEISHGEAIAVGMKLINLMAAKHKLLPSAERDRINKLINELNIIRKPYSSIVHIQNSDKLWKIMQSDKKVQKGNVTFVVVTSVGHTIIYDQFTKKDLASALAQYH